MPGIDQPQAPPPAEFFFGFRRSTKAPVWAEDYVTAVTCFNVQYLDCVQQRYACCISSLLEMSNRDNSRKSGGKGRDSPPRSRNRDDSRNRAPVAARGRGYLVDPNTSSRSTANTSRGGANNSTSSTANSSRGGANSSRGSHDSRSSRGRTFMNSSLHTPNRTSASTSQRGNRHGFKLHFDEQTAF